MSMLHTDAVDAILSLATESDDPVLSDMEARADREGFPTVGPEVGSVLRLLARLADAESVFEFGSGFGYSAYWVAPEVGPDGQVVLTEFDEDELAQAREYFERGGYADRAVFEHGDALDVVADYDGPFDAVLVDHQNHRYVEGFEAVREKVAPGGVVVADNVLHSSGDPGFDPADVEAILRGEEPETPGTEHEDVLAYFRHVRDDPAFETTVLPVGEGLFATVRTV